jgi:hypothetical protein
MKSLTSEIDRVLAGDDPRETTQILLRVSDEVNWQLLRQHPPDSRNDFFLKLWRFLLFSASHSDTNVRLSTYRTTGAFLLKVTPYYPSALQSTFADLATASTIDNIRSSGVIASAFAFISNFKAPAFLHDFVLDVPVFHHFSNSDPVFSAHLAPIIRHLGRLGMDWMRTLLHCFIEKVISNSDHYLELAICAIIKHNPLFLMRDLLA